MSLLASTLTQGHILPGRRSTLPGREIEIDAHTGRSSKQGSNTNSITLQHAHQMPKSGLSRESITSRQIFSAVVGEGAVIPSTRNLIGATVCTAIRLRDTKDVLDIWFVLPDLSVRTQGIFRLKFSMFNLTADNENLLGHGVSSIVSSAFSEPFTVYPAKKFPGMVEATELSRRFAAQGVKMGINLSTSRDAT